MKQLRLIRIGACATLLLAALAPRMAHADTWDRKTTINFSDAVQVPGTTLPAGTYVFKLFDSPNDRYVVQIFNERQNHVFATLLTIPEYRMIPPTKTLVTFYEAPAGQPQPIKTWFYPGDNNGREFVYSRAQAGIIAAVAHENVPVAQTALVETPAPAPQPAVETPAPAATDDSETPAAEPAPAPAVTAPPPEPQQEAAVDDDSAQDQQPPAPAAQEPPATPASMPNTGSDLPLTGLIGLASIGAAISVRAIRYARRSEVG